MSVHAVPLQPSARLLAAVHLAQWRAVREAAKGEEDMAAASAGMPRLTLKEGSSTDFIQGGSAGRWSWAPLNHAWKIGVFLKMRLAPRSNGYLGPT